MIETSSSTSAGSAGKASLPVDPWEAGHMRSELTMNISADSKERKSPRDIEVCEGFSTEG